MPSMANITLQNKAGVNVTATALVPSAGDRSAARWQVALSGAAFTYPKIEMASRYNGARDARRIDISMSMPHFVVDANQGNREQIVSTMRFEGSILVPDSVPATAVNDFVAYVRTFIGSTLAVSSMETGYAPT